jgi:hypothetical protein
VTLVTSESRTVIDVLEMREASGIFQIAEERESVLPSLGFADCSIEQNAAMRVVRRWARGSPRAVYYHERVRAGGLMTHTTNYAAMSTSPPPHLPTTLLIDKRATLVQDGRYCRQLGRDET